MPPAPAGAQALTAVPKQLRRSLILSGGGALGAYEAGAVQAMVDAAGVGEGEPLPQYGVIAGTSIGAFNGFLVATAQWSKLKNLWSSISAQNVVRPKPQYAKIGNASSGVINRLEQLLSLGLGADKDNLGVYDGEYLQAWLASYLNLSAPIVTPFFWAVTNMTKQLPEYFYALPPNPDPAVRQLALTSVRLALGPLVVVRESTPSMLVKQLRASAAVPIAFDPVKLPGPDGVIDQYCDGGVTDNTPVRIGRALSSAVDAVLLSPPFKREVYNNMIEVAAGSFNTMQRRLMYDALREVALETVLLGAVDTMPDAQLENIARMRNTTGAEIRQLASLLTNTTYFVLQPKAALPATLFGFNDAGSINDTYQLGQKDATAGFQPFDAFNVGRPPAG